MKRILSVPLLGMFAGVFGYYTCLFVQQPHRGSAGLDEQLAWIKADLRLTPEQYTRIKAIHEQSSEHLLILASRVARMREELAAFESQRTTTGQIDFLEFARFVDERRRIDRDCLLSSRQLVAASAGVLTPGQRERYFTFLPTEVRPPPRSTPN